MEKQQTTEESEITLLDIFIILLRRKRLILGGTAAVAIITLIIVLIVPPTYEGTSKIMPPQQGSAGTAAQLLGSLGGAAGMLLGTGTTATGDVFVGIMQSQAILYPIIDRFDLLKLYKVDTHEDASKIILDDILRAEVDVKSGIITVAAQDKDPKRATDMTNAFVEGLRKQLDTIAVTDSSKRRLFFEVQLKKAHEALSQSEEDLKRFQETTGTISIENQTAAVLQGVASLMAQISAKEVQMKVMRSYATSSNPDVVKADQELNAIREQLRRLQEKQENHTRGEVLIPTEQIPTLGTEYIRKMRDFKYNETLFELIAKQYEAARLEEARDSGILQVIHEATVPEKNVKPKKVLILILATAAGGICFTFGAFLMEFFEASSRNPENHDRIKDLKKYLKKF